LQGTWQGELKSTWRDPQTGATALPVPVILVIRQNFSSISCVLYSKESDSYSSAAQISQDDDSGTLRLSFNYTNRPKATIRNRSTIHDGAATLRIITNPEPALEGEYWTTRQTTGELVLRFKSRQLLESFPAAV